jgi:hypothetical protein
MLFEKERVSKDELADAVSRERKNASVRSLDLSLNELADMYHTGELQITPEYQRTFRWTEVKQSQFIESIILEMPLPPIFVVEVGEAKWELIDGLQRLSTYLHFRGQLELSSPSSTIQKGDCLKLCGCDILQELNGYTFDDLTTTLQHRVRRATFRVEIVRRESNPRFAYYMFKRLNSGGEPLSEQESRNCSIRLMDARFSDFTIDLSRDANFKVCTEDLTDETRARMIEPELVLRFFAFKNNLAEYVHDIEPFLTNYMERVSDHRLKDHLPFDYETEEVIFRRVFALLARTLGAAASRRWVEPKNNFGGGFSIGHYEAFSVGVSRHIAKIPIDMSPSLLQSVERQLKAAKREPELRNVITGGGKNFRRLYERKFEIVATHLEAALSNDK